jgi:hypothetical protein
LGAPRGARGAFSATFRSRAVRAFSPSSDVTSVDGLVFHRSRRFSFSAELGGVLLIIDGLLLPCAIPET